MRNFVPHGVTRADGFQHVRTEGIEQTQAVFGRLVRSNEVTVRGSERDIVSELQYAPLSRSVLSSALVMASMDVRASPAAGVCLVFGAIERPIDMRIGRRRTIIPIGGIDIVPPNESFEIYIAPGPSRSLMFEIEVGYLEAVVAQELRCDLRRPLRFRDGEPVHGSGEQSFVDLLGFTQRDLARGAPQCRNKGYVARLEGMLACALVYTRPHNYSDRLDAAADIAHPRYIRRAEDYMQARAGDEALTLSFIASVAAVSPRTLVRGFRKYRNCSPMSYLRSVRLDRSHADLLSAMPEDVSVTSIAAKWGFSNMGRFAALYRERFGEYPGTTLRRRS